MKSIAEVVAEAWAVAMRECPNPFATTDQFFTWERLRRSYREQLDEQPRNVYGDLIPRIVTVRRNLWKLGKPRRAPRLP